MEIYNKSGVINIISNTKNIVSFEPCSGDTKIDDLSVSFPGEYEKGGILLEVKEYDEILFYSFTIDNKHVVIISNDKFELKEEILNFFGDVDILIILGTKDGVKIYENIEARVVIPYGEGKSIFFTTLGQNIPEVSTYKTKGDLPEDTTEFVNLENK